MNPFVTAIRYAFSRKNSQKTTSVMIVLGLAVSIAAIIIIGSVVKALQSKQLDVLKTVESFDLIVESEKISSEDLKEISEISSYYYFADTTAIIENQALRIRALDFNKFSSDSRVKEYFNFSSLKENGIILSLYFFKKNSIKRTDPLNVTFLKQGKTATVIPYSKKMELSGIYSCSEQNFVQNTALIDLNTYKEVLGDKNIKIGIYLSGNQKNAIDKIKLLDDKALITTWQEYNKATYSALMLEKILIYIFMSFMILILCTSLRNSTQRLIFNRKNDAAILRALGLTKHKVSSIFYIQALILTLFSEIAGTLIGITVVDNINFFFNIFGFDYGSVLDVSYSLSEISILCCLVLVLSALFTSIACKTLRKNEIMEVILHENY